MESRSDEFTRGVFSAMQYLVVMRDECQSAAEIAAENGIKRDEALRLSRESGFG